MVHNRHEPVITRHELVIGGTPTHYTATVAETVVADAAGRAAARIVTFAYVADGVPDPATRPVIFLYNGGPIVPSVPLHMAAFGPRRVAFPDDVHFDPHDVTVVDNEHSLLDVADLVFFDPAGTGYSRVLDDVDPAEYYSVDADAQQAAAFIEQWLRDHGRLTSPVYMVGESYGTIRAAEAAKKLVQSTESIDLAGVVLISQATNTIEISAGRPSNVISPAVTLPTFAAIAWYHGKGDYTAGSLDEVIGSASEFAGQDYLPALFAGPDLPGDRRAHVAARLASFTGIPAERWIDGNLRIGKNAFRAELLAEEGLVLSFYDGRFAGPPVQPDDDPDAAMANFRASVLGTRNPAGDDAIPVATSASIRSHLRDFLKVDWPEEYRPMQPRAEGARADGEEWRWGPSTSPFGNWPYAGSLAEAMRARPDLRVFVATGVFDPSTTIGSAEHAVRHSGWPRDRVRSERYEGGHMMYALEASLRRLAADLRAFIAGEGDGR
ncbi:S10 family peptidase [Amycolatopsis sp. NPDC098790]|uniref:S10 family peptidase n=1 Tax=Amycolatopsis sp. NPDC098790 TaxID=3363939 RepID=UPI0037F70CE5